MHPNLTSGTKPQNLGIFYDERYENNVCVSSYVALQRNFKECKAENDRVMEEKSTMIFCLSILIILLVVIIAAESVMLHKFKTKIAAKKEEIIRLDRIFPYEIYEMPYQGPEPVYIEIE
jgi:hypothetical protein